jgi:predicted DNA-binding transcriptional regulator AlpA
MTNQKVEDKKQKKYMTSREVAARFDVSLRTLVRWRGNPSNGMPEPVILASGSHNRYLTSEIDAWEDAAKNNLVAAQIDAWEDAAKNN